MQTLNGTETETINVKRRRAGEDRTIRTDEMGTIYDPATRDVANGATAKAKKNPRSPEGFLSYALSREKLKAYFFLRAAFFVAFFLVAFLAAFFLVAIFLEFNV